MSRRALKICSALLAVLVVALAALYRARDRERAALDDDARRTAPGNFVRLSEGVTHFELSGPDSGRTVVLCSGFSVPYYLWDPTRDALVAARYRVLRYDYYGRGLSDRPDAEYDLRTFDRQLLELLDSLGVHGKVDIAGISMGGVVAANFANNHLDRVRTVTLIDPGFGLRGRPPFPLSLPGIGEYVADVIAVPSMPAGQASDFLHPERFPWWAERYEKQMQYPGFRRAILRTIRGDALRTPASAFTGLAASDTPILLIWGRQDQTVPFSFSTRAMEAFPKAEFQPLDSVGHIPHYERPDLVNPILLRFLGSH